MRRSCDNCVNSEFEPGDASVGEMGVLFCCLEEVDDEALYDACPRGSNEYEFAAERCGHYEPTMAGKCGFCNKPMPIPMTEVEHWCDEPFADYPVPACSEACALASHARTDRVIEEMNAPVERDFLFDERDGECPHGNDPAECSACMELGDFLADCAREARHFGPFKGRD